MLDEWRLDELGLWPEIWGQERVGLLEALENSSAEVLSSSGLSGTGSVNIINTSEMKDLLGNLSGNATGTSWCWDHSNDGGTALSSNLDWDSMDVTDEGTPISSSDWDEVDLSVNEGTLDGNLDLLSALDTNTTVTVLVSGGNDSLESSSLSGLSLLLYGKDAHDFIVKWEFGTDKSVDNWCFLDWDRVGIDFFKGFDVTVLDESSELGQWGPLLLVEATSASWSTSSTAATSATEASASFTSSITTATSTATSAGIDWCGVSCWGCCSFYYWCLSFLHFIYEIGRAHV